MKSLPKTSPFHRDSIGQLENVWHETYFNELAFDLWSAHLEWLHKLGWVDALRVEENLTSIPTIENPRHEVVELLQQFVLQTGYVNAHFGLTSSDVVDNVRLIQCQRSLEIILDQLDDFLTDLTSHAHAGETVAYTHLMPAAPISWSHRVLAWSTPVANLRNSPPLVHAKMFGGPVGDGRTLDRLKLPRNRFKHPFPWEEVFDVAPPVNSHPIQSSDHVVEFRIVSWICQLAAQLHKIAADLRILFSKGVILIKDPAAAGSSSMAHKVNPFRWEKACSILRSVATTQHEIWDVMAHNALERTLDTSWQVKRVLPRAFLGMAEAIKILTETKWKSHETLDSTILGERLDIFSDSNLTEQVINKGEPRWHAYVDQLKQKHKLAN